MKTEKYGEPVSSAGRLFGAHTIIRGGNRYMTRFWFGRLRVHIFHRGDEDPDCHDHPWGFWTFPLRSYVEEVLEVHRDTVMPGDKDPKPERFFTRHQIVKAFRFHYRPATHAHRVLGAYNPAIYTPQQRYFPAATIPTIVWREKPSRRWGFTKNRDGRWCWMFWKDYVAEGGKDAPCSPPK